MEASTTAETRVRAAPPLGLIATSTLASAVGVLVSVIVDHLGLAVAGVIARRDPVLYHNDVLYGAAGSDLALAGGTVLTLAVGTFFLLLYPGSRHYDGARLTALWVILHCFRQGFTEMALIPVSVTSNLSRAYAVLDAPPGLDIVVAAAGAVGLLSVALAAAPAFLAFAGQPRHIATAGARFGYAVRLALLPGAVGALLTAPLFLPDAGNGLIQTLPWMGAFSVATVLAAAATKTVQASGNEEMGWSWTPLAWLVVIGFVMHGLMAGGVELPPLEALLSG